MRLFELASSDKGTYVAATFSDQTISDLRHYQSENDIQSPVPGDDLHTTIVYSRLPVEWECPDDLDVIARAKRLHVWDTRSGAKCLVVELSCDYLSERFDKAMERGATYDFDDYIPHITLSYDIGDAIDVESLPIPAFPIRIVGEYEEEIDNDSD